jgi:hypothetical protein
MKEKGHANNKIKINNSRIPVNLEIYAQASH